jgi:hypothetical protein
MSGKLVTKLALAGILAVIVGIALLTINTRTGTLEAGRAGRTFTPKQGQAIYSVLRDKLPANFSIMAYGPTGDGVEYGSQLENLLVAAGWRSRSVVPLIVSSGEFQPTGITIMVDGRYDETGASARDLESALKDAQVEDVKFLIEQNLPESTASSWVSIKVGEKTNQ